MEKTLNVIQAELILELDFADKIMTKKMNEIIDEYVNKKIEILERLKTLDK